MVWLSMTEMKPVQMIALMITHRMVIWWDVCNQVVDVCKCEEGQEEKGVSDEN